MAQVVELSRWAVPGAAQDDKRWRVFEHPTEAKFLIVDVASVPPLPVAGGIRSPAAGYGGSSGSKSGAVAGFPDETLVLVIDRQTGEAAEVRKSTAELHSWLRAAATRPHAACYASEDRFGPTSSPSSSPRDGNEAEDAATPVAAAVPPAPIQVLRAYALLGIVCAGGLSHLLAVTEANRVCEIDGGRIFEVQSVQPLPLGPGAPGTPAASPAHAAAAALRGATDGVLRLLCSTGFYFSQETDITRTLQSKRKRRGLASGDLFTVADPRFVWNRRLVECLSRQSGVSSRWFLPVMQGHIQQERRRHRLPGGLGWEVELALVLMSRRGVGRAGTRYNARGLDDNGDTGGLVETEQLMHLRLVRLRPDAAPKPEGYPEGWLSLVQLRGSAPLFWEQTPTGPAQLTREPALSTQAFEKHQAMLKAAYEGDTFYVNLLADAPGEQRLTDALEQLLGIQAGAPSSSPSAASRQGRSSRGLYCHFDFHAKIHGASPAMLDAEVDDLMLQVAPFLRASGYFEDTRGGLEVRGVDDVAAAGSPASSPTPSPRQPPSNGTVGGHPACRWQSGVLRTSCLDCLDRTNVVQFFVAWHWLREFCERHPTLAWLLEPEEDAANMPRKKEACGDPLSGSLLDDGASALMSLQRVGASFIGALFSTGGATCVTQRRSSFTDEEDLSPIADSSPIVDAWKPPPLLRRLLQEMWADNGDRISQQYTGAGSIMSTLLRSGRMNTFTMLERSLQGINRVYQASFQDAQRQEAIDLLLGQSKAWKSELPVLEKRSLGPGDETPRAPVGSLSVWVGTWNVKGKEDAWSDQLADIGGGGLCEWLGAESCDVAVFSLQELVVLNPANIVSLRNGDEARAAAFESAALRALQSWGDFVKVRGIGMVGLHCAVFVRTALAPLVRGVHATRVRSGVFGRAGNKGTLAVRFELLRTTLCFISAHLESGPTKVEQRFAQLKTAFHCFDEATTAVPAALEHDVLSIAGDFNMRLDLPPQTDADDHLRAALHDCWDHASFRAPGAEKHGAGKMVARRSTGSSQGWRNFLRFDQLRNGMAQHLRPDGLLEGPIEFPPTYRLVPGSNVYDSLRTPAWCDRVLYKAVGTRLKTYSAVPGLQNSDHKPVFAVLEAILLGSQSDKRALEEIRQRLSIDGRFAGAPQPI